LLAGLCVKNFSYVAFISAKLSMLVRNTLTLTTLEISEPASLSTADRFLMQSSVICVMVEESSSLRNAASFV
ncbi:protein HMF1, partial [Diplocarpon rosae]